ncbi:MAG: hypothetical protein KA020_03680 [Planctomycetes bacterium]|nr:hypothetical protein [Planctomycetota bacterium]MCC7064661.1 hypothetical protein [Planctomycetota bacterium]
MQHLQLAGAQLDAASALGIAPATADRDWAYARAWLRDRLQGPFPERTGNRHRAPGHVGKTAD